MRPPHLAVPLLGLVALAAAGCASTDAAAIEPLAHPYKVVLLPVEGAEAALAPRAGDAESAADGEVPFALTPDALRGTIREGILGSRVFSEVVVVDGGRLATDEFTDAVAAAAPVARHERADLILRVRVSAARLHDLGRNDSTWWSTFAWFMIPAPLFTVDDRTYATTLTVNAELFDPADPRKPTASVVASSGEETLDLWDRGVSYEVIYTPPPWLEGDLAKVSTELTNRAVRQMMTQLVEELRTREIPSRFDVALAWEGADLAVTVSSRRRLRSLDVRSGDTVIGQWAERETAQLVDETASTPELTVYRARVTAPPGATGLVRVVAEDEAGGREVRSIPAGGGR